MFKSVDTAKTSFETRRGGVRVVTVEHELMQGVTAQMLQWWFLHLDSLSNWNGRDFSGPPQLVYRHWHPRDHISITQLRPGDDPALGGCALGARVRIQEKVLCKYDLDSVVRVAKSDEEALNLEFRLGPLVIGTVEHYWRPGEDGCSALVRITIGTSLPVIGPLVNWFVSRTLFSDELMQALIQHNVEEFGQLEKFLPILYRNPGELWRWRGAFK